MKFRKRRVKFLTIRRSPNKKFKDFFAKNAAAL